MNREQLLKDISWGTVVKASTQKGQRIITDYQYAQRRCITDVRNAYGRCSEEKKESFDRIERRAHRQGVYVVFISGYSSMSYSTVYSLELDDNTVAYIKDTKDNTYIVFA